MHLRLDPHNFLPSVAIVDTAGQLDEPPARELCVGPLSGVIVVPGGSEALLVCILLRFQACLSGWVDSRLRLGLPLS
jgi:hypothetical protein